MKSDNATRRVAAHGLRDAAVAAALAAVALLFWRLRLTLAVPGTPIGPAADVYTQIYPMVLRAAAWMRAGHLPLWNPYQSCGAPFLASSLYGVLYPPHAVYLILPPAVAMECVIILHLFAAGVFTYGYGRTIGLQRPAASLSAAIFMLSGYLAAQSIWFPAALNAAAWLPLGFLAVEHLARAEQRRAVWLVPLALAVAMPILAGWLQIWLYSMYAVGAYVVAHVVATAWRDGPRRAVALSAWCGVGIVLGLGLAAVQLLPSLELQRLGPRAPGGLSLSQQLLYGAVPPQWFLAQAVDSDPTYPRDIYIGIIALVLAPLSVRRRAGRLAVGFLWAMAALSLGVAFTLHTPLFALFRLLPGATWFRIPWRIVFLYGFSLAMLSGVAFDHLMRSESPVTREPVPWRPWLPFIAAALVAAALIVSPGVPERTRIYAGIGMALIAIAARLPPARNVALGLLAALAIGDLMWATESIVPHPFQDQSPFDREAAAFEYVQARQGWERTYIQTVVFGDAGTMPKQGTLREIFSTTDYEPLSLDRYAKFANLLAGRFPPSGELPFAGFASIEGQASSLRLLDLMSVRFILTSSEVEQFHRGLEQNDWRLAAEAPAGSLLVYENPRPLPRAYVAFRARVAANPAEAIALLPQIALDRRKTVLLEAAEGPPPMELAMKGVPEVEPARIAAYEPTRVVIETASRRPGYLVLTDTFYPGWRAEVDGTPQTIYRANYLFRALFLPAGRHTVRFEYAPASVRLGAVITGLAAGVLLLLLLDRTLRK